MGDLQPWLPHQNGFFADHNQPPPSPPLQPPLNTDPSEIREESWRVAEMATEGVIEEIQATVVSERRRLEVVEFMQRLFRYHLNCEVKVSIFIAFRFLLLFNHVDFFFFIYIFG